MKNVELIKTVLEELENAGLLRRTGEWRWSDWCNEWQPIYIATELGKALDAADIEHYLKRRRCWSSN
jgi:hypothetical protein